MSEEMVNILYAALGGLLIGLGAGVLYFFYGRIAGISGIYSTLMKLPSGDTAWRGAFIGGLIVGGLLIKYFNPNALGEPVVNQMGMIFAGLLVGFGTSMGSGCTSGHGICGVPRLSIRSFVATGTFLLIGIITASIIAWMKAS